MKKIRTSLLVTFIAFNAGNLMINAQQKKASVATEKAMKDNPFLKKSPLQYQAPEFDKIKDEHFKPAFEFGLKEQLANIDKIVNDKAAPTFENTVLALENSGETLGRATILFYNLTSSNTNDNLQKLEEEYAPIFASHSDKINLNDKLYKRLKAVKTDKLDAESKRLTEFYITNFELAGANLSAENKEKLKEINQQLATLGTQFSNKLLEARKKGAVLISDVKELDGLSADEIAAAATDAEQAGQKGKYLLVLQNTTQQPLLQNLKNRATREKLFKASWTRAEKETKMIPAKRLRN